MRYQWVCKIFILYIYKSSNGFSKESMLTIISPAKRLELEKLPPLYNPTIPDFLEHSEKLINKLKTFSQKKIAGLMDLSEELVRLNIERYARWQLPFSEKNSFQTIYTFHGDVYRKLDASSLKEDDLIFAQEHLRILSGLYGVLRPLDLIQPYRLEMGTKLVYRQKKNLYEFWGNLILDTINQLLEKQNSKVLINLASNEYFKSVKPRQIKAPIITPVFKDFKNGEYKVLFLFAKYARGLMVRYIINNKIETAEELKLFNEEGYSFDSNLSTDTDWVFTR